MKKDTKVAKLAEDANQGGQNIWQKDSNKKGSKGQEKGGKGENSACWTCGIDGDVSESVEAGMDDEPDKVVYHGAFDDVFDTVAAVDPATVELAEAEAAPSGVSESSPAVAVAVPFDDEERKPLQDLFPFYTPASPPHRPRWKPEQERQFFVWRIFRPSGPRPNVACANVGRCVRL